MRDDSAPPDAAPEIDLRLVPIAVAAWLAAWLGTWGSADRAAGREYHALLVVVAGALTAGFLAQRRRSARLLAISLVVLGVGLVGATHRVVLATGQLADLARSEAIVTVELTPITDADIHAGVGGRAGFLTLRATVTAVSGRGADWRVREPVLVVGSGDTVEMWRKQPVGTMLRTTGRLQPPDPGSDLAAILRIRGPTDVLAPPNAGMRLVERVRDGLRRAVEHRAPGPRALVPALVLGDTSGMTEELTTDFATTGLTHLTAVSGANLTLLLAFLLLAARWLGVRGWWLRLIGLLGVIIFICLCRTEPSVLRASAMGLVALAALGLGGRQRGLRSLCAAMVVLLLLDPYLSRSLGFMLSVLASAGIVWWAGRWTEVLSAWLPRLVAEGVTVSLSAHLATLPVVAAISGRVSLVGLLANVLAGPLVGPATVLGFAAAGLSLVSPFLAACAGFGAAWTAQVIIWISELGAQLPGASWTWPSVPVALVVLGVGSFALACAMSWILARRWLCLALVLIMIIGLAGAPRQPGWPPSSWSMVACDVGQGDGLVLWAGDRTAVVVDAGPDPVLMDRCLDQLGVDIVPLLIMTHFHADHVDGWPGVFDGRAAGQVWVGPSASQPALQPTLERLRTVGADVVQPPVGSTGSVGALTWQVLGPLPGRAPSDDESGAENDASLVIKVETRGLKILLTGDVEPPGQAALVTSGVDLRAEVLKVPHHGSSRQDSSFLAATQARVAVVSAGVDNDYGHPAPRTVAALQSLGMTVLSTNKHGAIALSGFGDSLRAVTQR